MSVDIRVPTTGNAGEDAVVVELKVQIGSTVAEGDVVAVLETAKATVEVEAPSAGVVLDVRCKEGDEVPEYSTLFVIGAPGEEVVVDTSTPNTSNAEPAVMQASAEAITNSPSSSEPRSLDAAERVIASPRARILAERNGVNLAGLRGSGPGGRVIVPDVLAAKSPGPLTAAPAPQPTSTVVAVRGARKVTAQRMTQSLSESAQVTLNRYVSAGVMQEFTRRLRSYTELRGLPKVGINDFVNFAVATVLPNYPAANSYFSWDGIEQFTHVNLGVAVDTGSALLVPVIPRAHELSLLELAAQARTMAERARSGGLDMADMENGTFTVTNLGMLGVHWFTPVLNPPQSCILGVGAIHQPIPESPALLPLSLTFDHRALDGAEAARALAAISDALENIDAHTAVLPTSH